MAQFDQESLRQVQWSQSYLWDVKFVDQSFAGIAAERNVDLRLPKPFDSWFPAQDVEDGVADLESFTIESAQANFKIPRSGSQQYLKLTFIDDADHQLLSFFEKWIEETILREGASVATLKESVKIVQLMKLDSQRRIIEPLVRTYWVYPEGNLVFHGSGESSPVTYSLNLVKVGIAKI